MKNENLTSYSGIRDENTGEIIRERSQEIRIPDNIRFPGDFCKVHGRAKQEISDKYLGYFVKLTDCLDYHTNRLVDNHVGRSPVPLNQKDISKRLNISERTVRTFMKEMKGIHAIFIIKGNYYINPSFASRSGGINSDIVLKMIETDSSILDSIDIKQRSIVRQFISLPKNSCEK